MTDLGQSRNGIHSEMHADLLRVVATAGHTNQLLNRLQVPADDVFNADKPGT
jgi:hypothetical protein